MRTSTFNFFTAALCAGTAALPPYHGVYLWMTVFFGLMAIERANSGINFRKMGD